MRKSTPFLIALGLLALAAPARAAGTDGETAVPTPATYQNSAQQSAKQVKQAVSRKVDQAMQASNALVPHAPAPAAKKAPATAKPPTGTTTSPRKPSSSEERHLLNREVYVYKTVGRRDPFASLLTGEFETTVGRPLLDVSSMKLVGIVWGSSDKFALVEDGRGHGHVLRVGDPVINGSVVGLTKDELMIRQSSYGDTQTVTIQLQRKEGSSDE
jgi:hypothetical protein